MEEKLLQRLANFERLATLLARRSEVLLRDRTHRSILQLHAQGKYEKNVTYDRLGELPEYMRTRGPAAELAISSVYKVRLGRMPTAVTL
jgi:hypothetical protein